VPVSFVNLLLEQMEQQAKVREGAATLGLGSAPDRILDRAGTQRSAAENLSGGGEE
jgi:hypothetical protein